LKGVVLDPKSSIHAGYSTCGYDGSQYHFKTVISTYRSSRFRANLGKPGKAVLDTALALHSDAEENFAPASKSGHGPEFLPPLPHFIHSSFPNFSTASLARNLPMTTRHFQAPAVPATLAQRARLVIAWSLCSAALHGGARFLPAEKRSRAEARRYTAAPAFR